MDFVVARQPDRQLDAPFSMAKLGEGTFDDCGGGGWPGVPSGLADTVSKLEGIKSLSMVRFGASDVVRHPLVGRIVEAYEGPSKGS